jgi:hypothetical protein
MHVGAFVGGIAGGFSKDWKGALENGAIWGGAAGGIAGGFAAGGWIAAGARTMTIIVGPDADYLVHTGIKLGGKYFNAVGKPFGKMLVREARESLMLNRWFSFTFPILSEAAPTIGEAAWSCIIFVIGAAYRRWWVLI